MNLTAMTLQDLYRLRDAVQCMIDAAVRLQCLDHGEDGVLVFDLTPGAFASITLPFRMPEAAPIPPEAPVELVEPVRDRDATEDGKAARRLAMMQALDATEDAFVALSGLSGEDPAPAAPAAPLSEPAPAEPAAEDAAGEAAEPASARGMNARPWTAEDAAALAAAVAACVAEGRAKAAAFRQVATDQGRTFEAVKKYATTEAKGIIAEAIARLPAVAPKKPRVLLDCPHVLGPLTPEERARIAASAAAGVPVRQIAAELNRRSQTVALYLKQAERQGGAAPSDPVEPAPAETNVDPAPAEPQAAPAPVAPRPAAPRITLVPDAAPAPTAAAPVPTPAPEPEAPRLTLAQREIAAHLDSVRDGAWPDADDLQVVHGLSAGLKLHEIAIDIGRDLKAVQSRFFRITTPIRDDRGRVSITGQADLLAVLRIRAETAAGADSGVDDGQRRKVGL